MSPQQAASCGGHCVFIKLLQLRREALLHYSGYGPKTEAHQVPSEVVVATIVGLPVSLFTQISLAGTSLCLH